MEKTRVPKGEKLWFIDYFGDITHIYEDYGAFVTNLYDVGNYFHTKEEAEAVARKLRAVLNGAEVIEMPSEEELRKNLPYQQFTRWSDGELGERNGWRDCYRWFKSKIVK